MSLEAWQKNGWLRVHETSREEIQNLFSLIKRDLKESQIEDLSDDWKFAIAYNACLQCCTIPLYCSGFRPGRGQSQHYRTITSLTLTLGEEYQEIKNYLDACRAKRNVSDYDRVGTISTSEANELIETAQELYNDVWRWVKEHYPQYMEENHLDSQ